MAWKPRSTAKNPIGGTWFQTKLMYTTSQKYLFLSSSLSLWEYTCIVTEPVYLGWPPVSYLGLYFSSVDLCLTKTWWSKCCNKYFYGTVLVCGHCALCYSLTFLSCIWALSGFVVCANFFFYILVLKSSTYQRQQWCTCTPPLQSMIG